MSPEMLGEGESSMGTGGETLANFLSSLEEITPTIPDSLTSQLVCLFVCLSVYCLFVRLLFTEERIQHFGSQSCAADLIGCSEVHLRDFKRCFTALQDDWYRTDFQEEL